MTLTPGGRYAILGRAVLQSVAGETHETRTIVERLVTIAAKHDPEELVPASWSGEIEQDEIPVTLGASDRGGHAGRSVREFESHPGATFPRSAEARSPCSASPTGPPAVDVRRGGEPRR